MLRTDGATANLKPAGEATFPHRRAAAVKGSSGRPGRNCPPDKGRRSHGGHRPFPALTARDAPGSGQSRHHGGNGRYPKPAVAVEDFVLSHDRTNRTLTVKYKLINRSGAQTPVQGRAYVVLGSPPTSVADVHRKRRRGNRLTSGSPFSIRRFKEIEFSVGDQVLKKEFQNASVIVFTGNGKVLLQKRYDVDITSS
jgi:hypothetical protein